MLDFSLRAFDDLSILKAESSFEQWGLSVPGAIIVILADVCKNDKFSDSFLFDMFELNFLF